MSSEYFGFNTTQAKTLERLMGSDDAGLAALAAAVAPVSALPTADPGDGVSIWNDEGVLKVATGP